MKKFLIFLILTTSYVFSMELTSTTEKKNYYDVLPRELWQMMLIEEENEVKSTIDQYATEIKSIDLESDHLRLIHNLTLKAQSLIILFEFIKNKLNVLNNISYANKGLHKIVKEIKVKIKDYIFEKIPNIFLILKRTIEGIDNKLFFIAIISEHNEAVSLYPENVKEKEDYETQRDKLVKIELFLKSFELLEN